MKYKDDHFRKMLTKEQSDLLKEYERTTKRTVHLDYMRISALATLANRDVTVDDIFVVVRYVKQRIRAGDNKRGIGMFKEASLEFVNLLGDTGKFQDRLLTARNEMNSHRIVKGKRVAVTHPLGDGDTITRLEDAPERAPEVVRSALASFLTDLTKQLTTDAA